jgi:hypothetical protein
MIDPLTIISLIGLGLSAGTTAGKLIPTGAERQQRQRIKELRDLEAKGQLGLTAQQRADLTSLGLEPLQAKERELRARAGETIGLEEVGAGGSILRQQATEDAIRQATKDVGLAVQQADLQEAKNKKQELEALKQNELAIQGQTKAEVLQGIQDIAAGGVAVAAQTQRAKEEGLLRNSTQAYRDLIVSTIDRGEFRMPDGKINPLVKDSLIRLGFSNDAIAVVMDMPDDELYSFFSRAQFAQPIGSAYRGFNPPGMGFYGPAGGR